MQQDWSLRTVKAVSPQHQLDSGYANLTYESSASFAALVAGPRSYATTGSVRSTDAGLDEDIRLGTLHSHISVYA